MIHFTLYRGARNPVPIDQADFADWGEVTTAIRDLVADPVSVPNHPDLKTARETAKTTMLAFGPYRLTRPYRTNENVAEVTALVLDVDVVPDLDALLDAVAKHAPALVYASPSDAPGDRRVRILAPIDRPITPDECARTRFAFAEALGLARGCGVEKAHEPSRIFFAGRLDGTAPREVWEL